MSLRVRSGLGGRSNLAPGSPRFARDDGREEKMRKIVDMRSDTLTKPTEQMRRAIYEAEVGDDVYGEDPTVNRLEAMAAERMGKEAAVLVSSGTMSNLVAVLAHTHPGDSMIVDHTAHIHINECGSAAAFGGVHTYAVDLDKDYRPSVENIRAAIRKANLHFPETSLICLENTHNTQGGSCISGERTKAICDMAHENGCKVHIDGARIFNAAEALGVDVAELARHADSITFCLSKGLGGPIGSILNGGKDFIQVARKKRKMLGGAMRQAGIIAAAGIVALEEPEKTVGRDNALAKRFAEALLKEDLIELVPPIPVETNLIWCRPRHCRLPLAEAVAHLKEQGVFVNANAPRNTLRLAVYDAIVEEDLPIVLEAFRSVPKAEKTH